MIAVLLHEDPRWTRDHHFGVCGNGHVCGCCRADEGEFMGVCIACRRYAIECENVFRTIYAFFPKELVPEIQSLKSIDPWRRLHPEIVQCVSDFIPKDMRVGAVVVKLICMIRSWHSLF